MPVTLNNNSNIVIARTSTQRITVSNYGGALQTNRPLTLRNQMLEVRSITNIPDVSIVNQTDGASLVYNANTLNFEVRPITYNNIVGDIDEGEF